MFFEVNPGGQWLFAEIMTGQPIRVALARAYFIHTRHELYSFALERNSLPEADCAEKNRRISRDESPDESIETHNHGIGYVEEDA